MNNCWLGLDLGTTNMKTVALSTENKVLAKASKSMVYDCDNARVEFDLDEFYKNVCDLIGKTVRMLPDDVLPAGICISSASGNTVLLDEKNRPLVPAISWLDKRQSGDIKAVMGILNPSDVYRLIGWGLSDRFPLAHLCMLKRKNPGVMEKAARIGMSSDYINLRLCCAWAMDHSTATTFYLQDQVAGIWHKPYLDALGIPEHKLPRLLPVGTCIGYVTQKASLETFLLVGTPVFLGSFDHPSVAIGAEVIREGQLLVSCGTSWVGFTPVKGRERVINAGLLCDPFLYKQDLWGGYFSLPNAGQRVELYLDKFLPQTPDRFAKFDALAASAKPGAGGLKIDIYDEPSLELENYEKNNAARAVMESVAHSFNNKFKNLVNNSIHIKEITMAGGPSQSSVWPGILADMLGMPVKVFPDGLYAGAIGAAKIAYTNMETAGSGAQ